MWRYSHKMKTSFQLETLKRTNLLTKILIVGGFLFVVYGSLCRFAGIYFFWESSTIGWTFLFMGAIGYIYTRLDIRDEEGKKILGEKIAIGFLVFVLLIRGILLVTFYVSDAYPVAKSYLENNEAIKHDIGHVNGFGIMAEGAMSESSGSKGDYGNASLNLIVKGEKKYIEVTVGLSKTSQDSAWKVESVE
jgi:hypothetical protein